MIPPMDISDKSDDGSDALSSNNVKEELSFALSMIETPGSFVHFGSVITNPNPGLSIDGQVIGLPIGKHDADFLKSRCTQSPFGKGSATLVDTSVRNSWELDPSQFVLRNSRWTGFVKDIVASVHQQLFLPGTPLDVNAELYKLLLYEEGAYFKPHQDSEKTPGMFGTLVVCLPSSHQGGELVLRHDGKTVTFDTSVTSSFEVSFAAWYSDVLHEVKPVTSGHRLVLTYNLIQNEEGARPIPESITDHEERIMRALQHLEVSIRDEGQRYPGYVVQKLEHQIQMRV